jgi:SAM-dependent methyltransferase
MQTDLQQQFDRIVLEEAACPLCSGRSSTLEIEAADFNDASGARCYRVVRCAGCGLCFTNPRPTVETIPLAYPADYGPHQSHRSSGHVPRQRWLSRRLAHWRRRRQLDWQGQGRLLDFGCGSGSFLVRMHREGWNVVGVDSSAQAIQHIRSEVGLPALLGSLPHPELRAESFDVITMWQALEHVHDPRIVLESARRLLVSGGRIVLSVPNFAGAGRRWFGPDWFALDLPRHLTHFTPESLRWMVQQAGFRMERFQFVGHASWLQISAGRARRRGVKLGWRRWLLLRMACRIVAWLCVLAGTSDAMMLTAMADGDPSSSATLD